MKENISYVMRIVKVVKRKEMILKINVRNVKMDIHL